MALKLSPQDIKEIGQFWGSSAFTPEDFKNMLDTLPPQKRKDYFATFSPEELFMNFKPEERLIGLKPEERFIGLKPEERLAGLSRSEIEQVEEQIKKLKQQKKE